MSTTSCVLPFSERIRFKPYREWKAEIDAMPGKCPRNDCTTDCRPACREYAEMRWKIETHHAKNREAA